MPAGADGLLRLTAYYSYRGQAMQHNFWARVKETDPSPNWQATCDHMITDYIAIVWPRIRFLTGSSFQLTGTQAMTMTPRGTAQSLMGYVNEFGAFAGEGMPPHDAAVLSLYTRYPGRRTHGRLYVSGMVEQMQNGGLLTPETKTALKNLGDTLIQNFGELGNSPYYWWGVYSRANGATRHPGPPPFIAYDPHMLIPWDRHVPSEVIGTQRHRRIGRGS